MGEDYIFEVDEVEVVSKITKESMALLVEAYYFHLWFAKKFRLR